MKLWQLISVFRGHRKILDLFLEEFPDGKRYQALIHNCEHSLSEGQRSESWDLEIPTELCRQALMKLDIQFLLRGGVLSTVADSDNPEALKAYQVFDCFGGTVIEDVLEYGSVSIRDCSY